MADCGHDHKCSPAFNIADGRLSAYAFSCGYMERKWDDHVRTTLYQEGGVYHVRQSNYGVVGYVFWDTFDTLTEARKRYKRAIREGHEA